MKQKICEKCGDSFPLSIVLDNKRRILKNRRYCMKCSPFNVHNTKKLAGVDNRKSDSKPVRKCQSCLKDFCSDGKPKICNSCHVKKSQKKKKLEAIAYYGGKCKLCGYSKCPGALVFHHLSGKDESPSYIIHRWAWDKVKPELDKCILICSNCHMEIHYNEDGIKINSITERECEFCENRFFPNDIFQKYCSEKCCNLSNRKVERPTKEELETMIEKASWKEIGKSFGVSDNCVRKWAKQYRITWPKRKYG